MNTDDLIVARHALVEAQTAMDAALADYLCGDTLSAGRRLIAARKAIDTHLASDLFNRPTRTPVAAFVTEGRVTIVTDNRNTTDVDA